MHSPDLNTNLEIPGLPEENRRRIARILRDLMIVPDRWAWWHTKWRHQTAQLMWGDMTSSRGCLNEPQYLQRLKDAPDEAKRKEIHADQVSRRFRLIAKVLHVHSEHLAHKARMKALALELKELKMLLVDLPADHPLVGFAQSIAGVIRDQSWSNHDVNIVSALEEAKGLSVDRALEAVHMMYRQVKDGTAKLPEYTYDYERDASDIPEAQGAILELLEAMADAYSTYKWSEEPRRQFSVAKNDVNRPQFASRLEHALHDTRDGAWTFDQVKLAQVNAEASLYASAEHLKLWHKNVARSRARLAAALQAVFASLVEPQTEWWYLTNAFGECKQTDTYKAMVNCIVAQVLINDLDRRIKECEKHESDFKDFDTDPVAYVDAVLAETLPQDTAPPAVTSCATDSTAA